MQTNLIVAVLAALLAAASAFTCPPAPDPCPGQIVPQPVSPTETVEIFFLEAPLMAATYGNKLGTFHMFHAGIGFRMLSDGSNFTYQYVAANGFMSALSPIIENSQLNWCNGGAVCFNTGIDMTYWAPSAYPDSSITPVGQISGAGYNAFISEWLPKVVANPPDYALWQVEGIVGNMWTPSSTCQDMARNALIALHGYGAVLSCAAIPTMMVPTLVTLEQPKVVDPVADASELLSFYSDFPVSGDSTLVTAEKIVQLVFSPNKYNYYEKQYYEMTLPLLFATKYGVSFSGCQ